MQDLIIIVLLVVLIGMGVFSTLQYFKGKGGCCGGGNTYVSKKKLKHVRKIKNYHVEGMYCENCKARVERYINDMDGVAGKVNLKKKELIVSMEREVSDEEVRAAVQKAGYEIV